MIEIQLLLSLQQYKLSWAIKTNWVKAHTHTHKMLPFIFECKQKKIFQ